MMINIAEIAENLRHASNGVWRPIAGHTAAASLHYPDEGNDLCFRLEDSSFWFQHRNDCILAAVRLCPPSGMVLDVGGGNGFVSLALQHSGCEVALLEPGEVGIANARQRGVHTLICATLEDAGFRPASIPAVGLFDVLEHIDDDRRFLSETRQLLVPGGRLYLTTPAYRRLWSQEDEAAGHRRRYTLARLRSLLSEAGFRTDFASYFFFPLPLPILLARTLRRNAKSRPDDHRLPRGLAGRILQRMLAAELRRLQKGRPIPFGSSCLVVAARS